MREQHEPAGVHHFEGQVLAVALLMGSLTSIRVLAVALLLIGPNLPTKSTNTAASMALVKALLTSIQALAATLLIRGPNSPPNSMITAALTASLMALLTGIQGLATALLMALLTGIWSPPKSTPN
jgi:hypothetical protein